MASSGKKGCTEWNPLEIVESAIIAGQVPRSSYGCDIKYAIILLNQQVLNEELFLSLWNESSFRMLVDGGGNHWRQLSRKFPDLVQFPHVVCGNFDSIRRETLDLLRMHSSSDEEIEILQFSSSPKNLQHSPNWPTEPQPLPTHSNGSDFTQALTITARNLRQLEIPRILAYCETSGRFDQIMANVETLHKYAAAAANQNSAQLFLISSSSITFLLPEGDHRIFCGKRNHPFLKIRHCALFPIGSPCTVTTLGLRNDLTEENGNLGFGLKVVTNEEVIGICNNSARKDNPCNGVDEEKEKEMMQENKDNFMVQVSTSAPILWDMEYDFDNQLKNVW